MTGQQFIIKLSRQVSLLTLALGLSLSIGLNPALKVPAIAAAFTLTDAEVVNALEKAKILSPTIRINARVSPDEVMVATYKNPKAEDKDCKIDAVLIAKTVMDIAPGSVPRVTVYFYSSSTLSKYKQVEVTAGDVKAFAVGSLSKDELMASIRLKEGTISDPKQRIEEHLQESESHKRRKITSEIKGEEVLVGTALDPNLSERSLKFEAIKLAEQAFEASGAEIKKVIVTFEDQVERKQNQVLTFSRDELKTLGDSLDTTLKEVKVDLAKYVGKLSTWTPGTKVDLETLEIKDGPLKEERQKLLERLKELIKAGVSLGTVVTDGLMEIEEKLNADTEAATQDKVTKFAALVTKLEDNLKSAKEHKAVGGGKPTGNAALVPSVPVPDGSSASLARMVLADPDGYINTMAKDYIKVSPVTHEIIGKYKTADEVPNFRRNLQFAIDTLKGANRAAEAEKFQKRLDDIKAKYGG